MAAGGGGDVIAVAMVQRILSERGAPQPSHYASYSWDRLEIDPLPGPRDPTAFIALKPVGRWNFQVTASTVTRPPAQSHLPQLAADLATPIFLLDPRHGAFGLRRQLRELVQLLEVDRVAVVDVGGDILARGYEPMLRSPLADFLVLAASVDLGITTRILVLGLALDGELDHAYALQRCRTLSASTSSFRLTAAHVHSFGPVFERHPSEVTGLLWLSVMGYSGRAEIRDEGLIVDLGPHGADVYEFDPQTVLAHNLLGQGLVSTTSLEEVEVCFHDAGLVSELDYEREKAAKLGERDELEDPGAADALAALREYEADAARRGVDFLILRRVRTVLGLSPTGLERLRALLRAEQYPQYLPPVWLVRA